MNFEAAVYLLCLLTSAVCAVLLIRSWIAHRQALLAWSAACFCLLALNNLVVVLDMLVLKEIDLTPWREATALAAVCVLLFGFIWRTDA